MGLVVGTHSQFSRAKAQISRDARGADGGNGKDDNCGPMEFHVDRNGRRGTVNVTVLRTCRQHDDPALDLPTIGSHIFRFVNAQGEIMHRYSVPKMSCGHCAGTIDQAIKAIDPGADVIIDIQARQIAVRSGESAERIEQVIRSAGYETAPVAG